MTVVYLYPRTRVRPALWQARAAASAWDLPSLRGVAARASWLTAATARLTVHPGKRPTTPQARQVSETCRDADCDEQHNSPPPQRNTTMA